ncbi:MAG: hypothetical protein IKS19_00620 [Clostridia bacterium]|nr:hypothetical protein [Clostridia bacterium]
MTGFQMKIVAVISMLTDHIGYIFFPREMVFRVIGRIAFPIYAFLIAEGFGHTKSRIKYAARLGLFALISEIPFDLAFCKAWFDPSSQNVFISLLLGLLCIWTIDELKTRNKKLVILSPAITAAFGYAAFLLKCDYTWYAVLLITVFYFCLNSRFSPAAGLACCVPVYFTGKVYNSIKNNTKWLTESFIVFNCSGLLAIPFIAAYNGEKGYSSQIVKIAFYVFYPAHLLILYGIYLMIH